MFTLYRMGFRADNFWNRSVLTSIRCKNRAEKIRLKVFTHAGMKTYPM